MARKWLLEIDKKAFSYGLIYVESGRLGRKFNKKKMFFKFFFYFVVLFRGIVYICQENYKPK